MSRISAESSHISRVASDDDIPVVKITVSPEEYSKISPKLDKEPAAQSVVATASNERHVDRKAVAAGKELREPFVPRPYLFKMARGAGSGSQHVRSPPQWLLMDHTLAVIWALFSPKKEQPLGVVELHWALAFLRSVLRGGEGEGEGGKAGSGAKDAHADAAQGGGGSADVRMCVRVIEERLLRLYAHMDPSEWQGAKADCRAAEGLAGGAGRAARGCGRFSPSPRAPSPRPLLSPIQEECSKNALGSPKKKRRARVGPAASGFAEDAQAATAAVGAAVSTPPVSATMESVLRSQSCSVYQLFKAGSSAMHRLSDDVLPSSVSTAPPTPAYAPVAVPAPAPASAPAPAPAPGSALDSDAACYLKSFGLPSGPQRSASSTSAAKDLPLGTNASKDEVLEFLRQWRYDQETLIDKEIDKLKSIEEFLHSVDFNAAKDQTS